MADGNGDYLARFERIEKILERMAEVQEVQARNLTSLVEVQQIQAGNQALLAEEQQLQTRNLGTLAEQERAHAKRLFDHDRMLERIETGLAEATDKVNFIIQREMRREGGPEGV